MFLLPPDPCWWLNLSSNDVLVIVGKVGGIPPIVVGICIDSKTLSVLVPTHPELYVGLPRRNQVCLTRLRLGNETTNDVLFKVGKAASPECDGCSVVLDSSYHRMYECASLASQRLALKQRLRLIQSSLDFNYDVVLGLQWVYSCTKQKVVHAFCDFLESTGLNKLFLWRPTVSNEEDLT